MRIDVDNCRDLDLLVAEVRRLQAVIAASDAALSGGAAVRCIRWLCERIGDDDGH